MNILLRISSAALLLLFSFRGVSSELHPVFVVETEGDLDIEVSNAVLKEITDAAASAVLRTIAKASYATNTQHFPKAAPYRGQVEMLADAFRKVDMNMYERLSKVRASGSGRRVVRHQMYWTAEDRGAVPVSGEFVDLMLGLVTQHVPNKKIIRSSLDVGASALKSQMTRGSAALTEELKLETFDRFNQIYAMKKDIPAWPVHFFIEYTIDGSKGVKADYRFLFVSNYMQQDKKDLGIALLDRFAYDPLRKGKAVMEFGLQREYKFQASPYVAPVAKVTFGRIQRGDMRPTSCQNDECIEWIESLPTMYMQVNPATNSWFTRTQAWLGSFDRFDVLFRAVGINLVDFSMDPVASELLFHVDGWLGGTKIIDMKNSKARNWFEYFAQRKAAIEGRILPSFDQETRKRLDQMMTINLDELIFGAKQPVQK